MVLLSGPYRQARLLLSQWLETESKSMLNYSNNLVIWVKVYIDLNITYNWKMIDSNYKVSPFGTDAIDWLKFSTGSGATMPSWQTKSLQFLVASSFTFTQWPEKIYTKWFDTTCKYIHVKGHMDLGCLSFYIMFFNPSGALLFTEMLVPVCQVTAASCGNDAPHSSSRRAGNHPRWQWRSKQRFLENAVIRGTKVSQSK